MARKNRIFDAPDDQPVIVLRRDVGGGMNNRQHPQMIGENQSVLLQNILLETAGQTSIRTGQTLVDVNFPPAYLLDNNGNIVLDNSNIPVVLNPGLV